MRHKKKAPARGIRVAEQIQKDLAELIPRELRDPRLGFVTITDVELTPDYAYATVYFSVLTGSAETTEEALNDSSGYLRNLIFKKLHIHTVPTLRFKHDQSVERGAEMAQIIDRALKGEGGGATDSDGGGDGGGD
ncbi:MULTISPECIES: 30S ribosome-binding factor RbfA [unclassified Limnobacter]|jgi:ribosome-binding factor A|uniref:30S ribosome-binding factor RbfA n=1 Tax=unclassified Limnobacter TaxID=2630203 RepID=UPI000156C505|nr:MULTISPECIES: 30S ribosome-binding factor RbfA [unclassified Limnobacter]EDM84300.1 ribosome-binding factor A [Limnobacter sp. MED105]MAZ10340.1 30S ribosome-binding factor RbfA [Sutterellaceae bacterium]|tara:strand:+ start:10735 stop:11139 length:405 start_codon:yes stop_codon:yes gene_type:complete